MTVCGRCAELRDQMRISAQLDMCDSRGNYERGFADGVRKAAPVWVSVKTAKPEPDRVVLIWWSIGTIGMGPYQPAAYPNRPWTDLTDVDMCGDPNHLSDGEVSHWMALPDQPGAGKFARVEVPDFELKEKA